MIFSALGMSMVDQFSSAFSPSSTQHIPQDLHNTLSSFASNTHLPYSLLQDSPKSTLSSISDANTFR